MLYQVLPGTTESLGVLVLKSRGFLTNTEWYWIGVGALFGYILLLNGTIPLALAYLNREFIFPDLEHYTTPNLIRFSKFNLHLDVPQIAICFTI